MCHLLCWHFGPACVGVDIISLVVLGGNWKVCMIMISKKKTKVKYYPIDNIFSPTDIVLSGHEKLCADFFDILHSSSDIDFSQGKSAFGNPDCMSPAIPNSLLTLQNFTGKTLYHSYKNVSVGQHNIKVEMTPIAVAKHQNVSKFEAIMRQRWLEANMTIPLIDKKDI